ncbi:hypothetical protein GCM10027271_57740 [Saccharopolyspora gloriosae]|uniref:Uncharacterized protein n=1 Tax=Saccharopolyspora gloriosae TaxID=455344 RepID=A0A840NEV1_9PSEU|nr:hypothetical protein [Saccharopolyspora gloriosae]MBB5067859.1 hypothetical protein [Saccharopolyspora gloriosae]
MEINNDAVANQIPQLVTRKFQLSTFELGEPRAGIDINDNAALLECLDTEQWS